MGIISLVMGASIYCIHCQVVKSKSHCVYKALPMIYNLIILKHRALFSICLQLERAYQPELMLFIVMVTIGTILYVLSDYLKAVVLCFQLTGPPARFLLGNVLLIKDKDSKFYVRPFNLQPVPNKSHYLLC